MSKPTFVYVTYIATTPEKLWRALIDGEMTRKYWSHENVSDWKPGSRWEHRRLDAARTVDLVGKVVESTPPRRLVLTWAVPSDADDPAQRSRVTFDIESQNGLVRLTVRHEDLEPNSEMLAGINQGWPTVLSSLKTLLETGQPLPEWSGS
jgi:uncharacterized protein YndB with AHSA1/START domain